MSGGPFLYVPHDPIPMSFDIGQGQKDVDPGQTQGRRLLVGEASGALDSSIPYVGVLGSTQYDRYKSDIYESDTLLRRRSFRIEGSEAALRDFRF